MEDVWESSDPSSDDKGGIRDDWGERERSDGYETLKTLSDPYPQGRVPLPLAWVTGFAR